MKRALPASIGFALFAVVPLNAQVTQALDAKYEQAKQRLQDTYVEELRKLRSELNQSGNKEGTEAVDVKLNEVLAPSFDAGLAGQSYFYKDDITLDFTAGNRVNGLAYQISGPKEIRFKVKDAEVKATFTLDWSTVTFATKNAVGADITWIVRKGDKVATEAADTYWIKNDGNRFTSAIKITGTGHVEETWWESTDTQITVWKLPYTKKGTDLEVVYHWGKPTFKFAKDTVTRSDGFKWAKASEKEYLAFIAAIPPELTGKKTESSSSKETPFGRREP